MHGDEVDTPVMGFGLRKWLSEGMTEAERRRFNFFLKVRFPFSVFLPGTTTK